MKTKKRLSRKFYTRPTLTVAKELLGKFLVCPSRAAKIVETEAYIGPKDRASHCNKTEYLEGGHIYIYLCYGMHWQLNITTAKAGQPECVLIRALETDEATGPGKLCRWLKLDKSFNGEDLCKSKRIWLEDRGVKIKKSQIVATKRIGIDYAGQWAKKPWRFYIKDNPFVSRKKVG